MNLNTTPESPSRRQITPWAWVPSLYMAEGLPYVLVNTVSVIMYTRFGADLKSIALWTSILGFAWTVKPLWGPLVDLYWTKRRWTVLMQVLLGLMLGVVAFTLQTDWWWSGSLLILAIVALFSATHDIAADGYYMDALDEKQQTLYVGIRSTFYRIAMIFGQGILLIIAGMVEQQTGPPPSTLVISAAPAAQVAAAPAVKPEEGFLHFEPAVVNLEAGTTASVAITLNKQPETTRTVTLRRVEGSFMKEMFPYGPERQVEISDKKNEVLKFNAENWNVPQQVEFKANANMKQPVTAQFKASSGNVAKTWAACFGGIGGLLFLFGLYHLAVLPKPARDGVTEPTGTPFIVALGVMILVVALPVALFYLLFKAVESGLLQAAAGAGINATLASFAATLVTVGLIWGALSIPAVGRGAKDLFHSAAEASGVPFDDVFASFFAKPGIGRMIAFLLLYRLGEALLVRMSGAFLVKPLREGGLGLSTAEYGFAYGTVGTIALTIGGILGGIVASRHGLKRWMLLMCFAINVPDALYVYLAYAQPPEFWKVLLCVSGESFGYGFGFTAYMIYMLYIADTGEHKTSHFALCTGFMALGMMVPGMLSGSIADALTKHFADAPNIGWMWFFIIVCIATIPGFLMLPIIPLDREFGRRHKQP